MATVHLPSALAGHSGGRRRLEVAGTTVGKVLAALGQAHPGVGQRVLDEQGTLRRHVNVFVNGESIRYLDGVETAVGDADEVWILPAVSGGARGG
jgi:sulfur-carrier protein